MENRNYWELFWLTGLPEVWLLSRWEENPEAVAAFAEEVSPKGKGNDVPLGFGGDPLSSSPSVL